MQRMEVIVTGTKKSGGGGGGGGGGGDVNRVRFDSKPSEDGEKDKKRRKKKRGKKIVFGAGFEPTTLRLQIYPAINPLG